MEKFRITLNGQAYEVEVEKLGSVASAPAPIAAPKAASVVAPAPVAAPIAVPAPTAVPTGGKTIGAPMPGKVVSINVHVGDTVKKGNVLLILEAMKMANEIVAPQDGQIIAIRVDSGQTVRTGDPMLIIG